MTYGQLKKLLIFNDLDFWYKKHDCSFCPLEKYWVRCDEDRREFDDYDAAINEPMFEGKSLFEIRDEIRY